MMDYKFYSTDQILNRNYNLLSGILPEERSISDIKEAYDYEGALIVIDSSILKTEVDKEIFNQRQEKNKPTKLLVDYSYETGCSEDIFNKKIVNIAKLGIDIKDVLFVFNRSAFKEWMEKHINQIVFIDLFAVSAAIRHAIYKTPASSVLVKDRPRKINLLIGKINKPYRLELLKSFYRSDIKKKTLFSILGMPTEKQKDDEFVKFLKDNQGPIDDVETMHTNEGVSSQGWSDNCKVYDKTSVSFICETHETNDSLFITEKTYRPILNRHPFVARASFPLIEYLGAIGFKTFKPFIDESYDKSSSISSEYFDNLVVTTEKLLEAIDNNSEEIQEIVDHNYETLIRFAQSELALLNQRIFSLLK